MIVFLKVNKKLLKEKADNMGSIVTADVMESTKQRVKDIGMNDYLAKPVNKDRHYLKITALLEEVVSPVG